MGKPNIRLNPQIDSIRNRVLLERGISVLCILRILLRKKYADYESEMRFDRRIMEALKLDKLPCKSTINNYALMFTLPFLSSFNKNLIGGWIKKPVDLLLDSSGIRLVGRSIWFCIRTKQKILKKECDKIHIAVSLCSLLIANFRISNSKRNDSPFLKRLLKPFRFLGMVIVDKGYSGKKNAEFVAGKKGAFFSPFKKNACPSGFSVWNSMFKLWKFFSAA